MAYFNCCDVSLAFVTGVSVQAAGHVHRYLTLDQSILKEATLDSGKKLRSCALGPKQLQTDLAYIHVQCCYPPISGQMKSRKSPEFVRTVAAATAYSLATAFVVCLRVLHACCLNAFLACTSMLGNIRQVT